MQQFMFSRSNPADRKPYYLHIDEFQNFRASEAFEKVLDMARGYKLCLTIANQRLRQLPEPVRSALGNIYSFVVFRINPEDESFYKKILISPSRETELDVRIQKLKLEMDTKYIPYDKLQLISYEVTQLTKLLTKELN